MAGRQYFAQSTLNSFTSNNHTLSVTVPSGLTNAVMLIIKTCNGPLPWTTFTGITVNGSSAGVLDTGNSGGSGAQRSVRAWHVVNPTPGTYNVQLAFNTSSSNGGQLTVIVYDAVDQTTPIADFKAATSGSVSSPQSTPTLSTPSGAWVVGCGRAQSGTGAAPAGGATAIGTANADEVCFEKQDATTMSFSWGGTNPTQASVIGIALNPASGDTTAPSLSSPTGTQTGSTTATVGATTDEGNGTLYAVVTTSSTQPSVAQIKAGQDHASATAAWSGSVSVSSTGAKTLNATGLTASTGYYAHLVHADAAANDSNRVSSAQFTTDAPGGGSELLPKLMQLLH